MMEDFQEYKKLGEPDKLEKSEIWQTAIGLQKVDGLTPSNYLIQTAKQNIDGEISIDEVKNRLNTYYQEQTKQSLDDRTEEADKVSARIAEILSEKAFSFSPAEYISMHKRLFAGILENQVAGQIRDYNISKREWVLNGESVYYASADSIVATLDYDFNQEKFFQYKGLSQIAVVEHIVKFTSNIWQTHAFGEGNTRVTAVFIIKYLRTLGFKVENNLFAEHSWYFRNALVRANYNDYQNNVYSTMEYLNQFFGNLLLGESHRLQNRDLLLPDGEMKNKDTLKQTIESSLIKTKDKILALLADQPKLSIAKMAQILQLSPESIRDQIDRMKQKGTIRRIGSKKGGHWEV